MRRKIYIAIAALLLVGFAALLSADKIAKDFAEGFKQDLAQSHIGLQTASAKTHFPLLLEYTKAIFTFHAGYILVPIELDLVKIQPYPSLLFFNRPSFDLYVEAYKGTINAAVRSDISDNLVKGDLKIDNLELGQHPHLQRFGIKGNISLTSKVGFEQDQQTSELELRTSHLILNIRHAAISGGSYFGNRLVLPRVSDINTDLEVLLNLDRLQLESFTCSSSLGSAKGSGEFQYLNPGEPTSGNLKIKISLSDEGVEKYGTMFAQISEERTDTLHKDWELLWSKNEGESGYGHLQPAS
jgi:hypothetical protein